MTQAAAFSGPVELTQTQGIYVRRIAASLKAERFISGCAYGVDTQSILGAWEGSPSRAEFVLTIPVGCWYNTWLEEFGRSHGWTLEYVEGGYMRRNDRTVALADVLHAFPQTPVPVVRSGTWATIRRAERKSIPVVFHPLTSVEA